MKQNGLDTARNIILIKKIAARVNKATIIHDLLSATYKRA